MENLNEEQLLKTLEHCSKSKYCDGCSMMYNPRVLEARSFDPDFSCGKMLIRWAVSIIKSQDQRIKELETENMVTSGEVERLTVVNEELTEDKKKFDRAFSDLYKEAETYLAQRECLRTKAKNLTEKNERLEKLCALRDQDNKDTQDLLYKAEAENEKLHAACTELERKCASLEADVAEALLVIGARIK